MYTEILHTWKRCSLPRCQGQEAAVGSAALGSTGHLRPVLGYIEARSWSAMVFCDHLSPNITRLFLSHS